MNKQPLKTKELIVTALMVVAMVLYIILTL